MSALPFLGRRTPKTKQIDRQNPNEDRYNPALRLYGDNTAEARIGRRNWQMFAFACLGVAAAAIFGMNEASHRPSLVPYVIVMDKLGQNQSLGVPARLDGASPATITAVQYQLRQFIQAVRGVVYDPGYETKLITEYVRPFIQSGSPAGRTVEDFYKINDPFKFERDRRSTVDVSIDQPVPQTASTYELHWIETVRDSAGNTTSKTEWKGFATIELHEVTTTQMRLNPLGMYVKQITWQNVAGDAAANGAR